MAIGVRDRFNERWPEHTNEVREAFAGLSLTADVGLDFDSMTDEEIERASFNGSAVAGEFLADLDAVLERYRARLEQLAADFGYWRGVA